MKFVLLIFILILACSCHFVTNTDIIPATYFKDADSVLSSNDEEVDSLLFRSITGNYIASIEYYSSGKALSVSGELLGRNYGHYFIMTPRKTLDSYVFNVGDGAHNSYSIKLGKDEKYTEFGSPFVDYMRDQSCTGLNDSLKCLYLLFSSFPRKKLKASASFDNVDYKPLDLKLSKVMPFLWECKLLIPVNMEKIHYKIEGKNLVINLAGISSVKYFRDSINLE